MVVVNNKTFEVYSNLSKADAGRIVGVTRNTIRRWKHRAEAAQTYHEVYNNYTIYFKETVVKQNKGRIRLIYT